MMVLILINNNKKGKYVKLGDFLIRNSEKIIEDIDYERIREITFTSKIEVYGTPTINVNKEYYPMEVNNDNN